MIIKNRISIFIATFLIIGFFFLALPEKGFAGSGMPPIDTGCCQLFNNETDAFVCDNSNGGCAVVDPISVIGFFEGEECNTETGLCSGFVPPIESRNVPTLSEWGLIALAGILGVIGFIMVMRRKKAAA